MYIKEICFARNPQLHPKNRKMLGQRVFQNGQTLFLCKSKGLSFGSFFYPFEIVLILWWIQLTLGSRLPIPDHRFDVSQSWFTRKQVKVNFKKQNCSSKHWTMTHLFFQVNNRTWETKKLNFDNVFAAMLTLYTSSTGEGWPRWVEYVISKVGLS